MGRQSDLVLLVVKRGEGEREGKGGWGNDTVYIGSGVIACDSMRSMVRGWESK